MKNTFFINLTTKVVQNRIRFFIRKYLCYMSHWTTWRSLNWTIKKVLSVLLIIFILGSCSKENDEKITFVSKQPFTDLSKLEMYKPDVNAFLPMVEKVDRLSIADNCELKNTLSDSTSIGYSPVWSWIFWCPTAEVVYVPINTNSN